MKLPDAWSRAAVRFDDANIVSFAGLAPLLTLAERAGLSALISEKVRIDPAATKGPVRGGGPGREADRGYRRDGVWCGLHR